MANIEKNPFLICKNCVNWGVRWKIKWRIRECSTRTDAEGIPYTPTHVACKHFVPKQGILPPEIQRLRLFAQALTNQEAEYLGWAIRQRKGLLELKDMHNRELAMGDFVQFRHGIHAYYGTVEGSDPDNPDAIVVNTPAFENATIVLLSSAVKKLNPDELKALIKKSLPPEAKEGYQWQITAIENEIVALRSAKPIDEMDLDERFQLGCLEIELRHQNALMRYFQTFR